MKRILQNITALALAMFCSCCIVLPAAAEGDALRKGETLEGFTVVSAEANSIMGGTDYLLEHKKSGAKLLYTKNDDKNRYFSIGFQTPAVDNTGVNHVLEHCTVSGSGKYPFNNVMMSIINQTYSTFANAYTDSAYTYYPVASASEAQLRRLMDVYLDCVYNPIGYTDENIFRREAWQYKLQDAKAPLELSGTVYSEMKGGTGDKNQFNYYAVKNALFPKSIFHNNSGGDPDFIPDLTFEQMRETHDAYYHPSNSLMILYGDLDLQPFLKDINQNYLKAYERKDVQSIIDEKNAPEPKFERTAVKQVEFPAARGTDTAHGGIINYAFNLGRLAPEDIADVSFLIALLNDQTSEVHGAFNNLGIGGTLSIQADVATPQAMLLFTANGVNPAFKNEFCQMIDSCMQRLLETGFPKEVTEAALINERISNSLTRENSQAGGDFARLTYMGWAANGNPTLVQTVATRTDSYEKVNLTHFFDGLIRSRLIENKNKAIITVEPKPGLLEEKQEKAEAKLAAVKAKMTSEELNALVEQTKAFEAWTSQPEQGDVKALQAISVRELPDDRPKVDVRDKTVGGIHLLSAPVSSELVDVQLVFDSSWVAPEDLQAYRFLTRLLGLIQTEGRDYNEFSVDVTKYLNNWNCAPDMLQLEDGSYRPVLGASYLTLPDTLDASLSLVTDILTKSDISSGNQLRRCVEQEKTSMEQYMDSGIYNVVLMRSAASFRADMAYMDSLTGYPYYEFLCEAETVLRDNPAEFIGRMEQLKKQLCNQTNMTAMVVTGESELEAAEAKIAAACAALPSSPIVTQDYSGLPKPSAREGIAINSNVNYNIMGALIPEGLDYGKLLPISLYIQDQYLMPNMRYKNGTYGAFMNMDETMVLLAGYRDPELAKTFEIMRDIPKFLQNSKVTQDQLDQYILKAYSSVAAPGTEIVTAMNALIGRLEGKADDDILDTMKKIRAVTPADVTASATAIGKMLQSASVTSAAARETLEKNRELFDTIMTLSVSEEKITRVQFAQLLYGEGEDAMALAAADGIYRGDETGNLFPEKTITREEFAVFLTRITDLAGLAMEESPEIIDMDMVSPWAAEAVKTVASTGLLKLDGGRFDPGREMGREDLQSLMDTLIKMLYEQSQKAA